MDHRIYQIGQVPLSIAHKKKANKSNEQTSFQHSLKEAAGLKVSKHAQMRMSERHIEIDTEKWGVMEEKVCEARRKGINDSLVIFKDAAFIVNAKNNTVITVMSRNEANSQIFTNITGAILID